MSTTIRPNILHSIKLIDSHSIVPLKNKRNILITAALPYVNNVPHLGNIIGALLSADTFARFCRSRDYNVLYISGTDEYGTATETKALEEGVSCQELCDKYFILHRDIYKWFDIATDVFGRSATEKQTEITQEIFWKLYDNGFFYEENVEQLFCEGCQKFLADRFVEGTCPLCGYHDARGDQCDGCGKLINAIDLIKPQCKIDRSTPTIRSSHHLFLDLNKLQPKLEAWVKKTGEKGEWSQNALDITHGWFARGLTGRCITRDLKWGTPVPHLEKHPDVNGKVFYVWFDACIGYISITANYVQNWRAWWQASKEIPVQLYQFMGKDNVPFHTVVFPGSLIGTNKAATEENPSCDWTLLHHLSTTEFLNYESGKFSKSRGVGVFGTQLEQTGLPPSVWRYYLLAIRPELSDSVFAWDDLAAKVNGDLVGNFGNFVSRIVKFIQKYYQNKVPELANNGISEFSSVSEENYASDFESDPRLRETDKIFIRQVNMELTTYLENMEAIRLKNGLKAAMAISGHANAYLSLNGLTGTLFKDQPEQCGNILHISINAIYLLTILLYPFLPQTTESLLRQLNAGSRSLPVTFGYNDILAGHMIGNPEHLFKRLDDKEVSQLRDIFSGKSKTSSTSATDQATSSSKRKMWISLS